MIYRRVSAPIGGESRRCTDEWHDGAPLAFDAAIAALDVEPTHHTDRMVTTYDILGLDAVRAAHRAEVERAVAEERALCERLLERRISDCDYLAGNAERGGNTLVRNEWEAKAAELRSALCAIRARGGEFVSEPINFFPINFEESIRYVDELNRRVWREGRERSTCPLYLKVLRRVEDLHATIYALSARVAKLEAEQTEARNRAARLEAALRFYADDANYRFQNDAEGSLRSPAVNEDHGAEARAALEDKP